MRAAQVRVIPGTCNNSSMLAELMIDAHLRLRCHAGSSGELRHGKPQMRRATTVAPTPIFATNPMSSILHSSQSVCKSADSRRGWLNQVGEDREPGFLQQYVYGNTPDCSFLRPVNTPTHIRQHQDRPPAYIVGGSLSRASFSPGQRAMPWRNLSFLTRRSRGGNFGKKTIVDLRPWQTAQALAPLAVTAEEKEYARNAMRLADHAVDQAFASALRQATLQAQNLRSTGEALELAQKVAQLQELIKQDQAEVNSITAQLNRPNQPRGSTPTVDNGDLEVAKAQLGLDNDQLADVQQDLDRESGDQSAQIHAELTAHEAVDAAIRQTGSGSAGRSQ